MNQTNLQDGTRVFCLKAAEAKVLDYHIKGYLQHGITIRKGDVVFDVGANIGILGVRIMQEYTDAQVFAFEPVPAIFEVLQKNAAVFGSRFKPFNIGIGKKESTQTFQYYPNSPALSTAYPEVWEQNPADLEQATLSQIRNAPPAFAFLRFLPKFVAKWIAGYMRQKPIPFQCNIKTISQIIENENISRIDLLKIDCEGAEYDVLLGIKAQDWDKIEQVVAEVYDTEGRLSKMKKLLENKGFSRLTIEEDKAVGGANLYNIYALKK